MSYNFLLHDSSSHDQDRRSFLSLCTEAGDFKRLKRTTSTGGAAHDSSDCMIDVPRTRSLSSMPRLQFRDQNYLATDLRHEGSNVPGRKYRQRWRIAIIFIKASVTFVKLKLSSERKPQQQYLNIELLTGQNSETFPDVDRTKFIITEMVKDKNLMELNRLGGVEGIAKLLNTNTENGIRGDEEDLRERCAKFASSTYEKLRSIVKQLFPFVVNSFKDIIFSLLLVCIILSMVLDIAEYGVRDGWYPNGRIIHGLLLMVIFSVHIKFLKQRQLDKLLKISNQHMINVVRDGRRHKVKVFNTVVGDVVYLAPGDQVPADGIFIRGDLFQVNESRMTTERDDQNIVDVNLTQNPFLLSGSKVVRGRGTMLVTSKGTDTAWTGLMSSIITNPETQTPLQARLDELTSFTRKVGVPFALIVTVITLIRYFLQEHEQGIRMADSLIEILSTSLVNVLVIVPGDLDLAFVLALVYSMKRMRANRVIVRKIVACETMGSTSVICTGKTGTFTLNQKKVAKFWVGECENEQKVQDFSQDLLELLFQGVAFNTTDVTDTSNSECLLECSGSSTEKAILLWAVQDLGMDIEKVKQDNTVLRVESFKSKKKQSVVLVRRKTVNCYHVHWMGAAETVLAMCTSYYEPTGQLKSMSEAKRSRFVNILDGMAASNLQCVALAYRKLDPSTFLPNNNGKDDTPNVLNESDKDLTLLGIIGMKDPCRPGSREAIRSCKFAGVAIKMITGDNAFMAKAIATDSGILESNQEVMDAEVIEGNGFQNYTPEERLEKVDNIRVMVRSSPEDKLLMVQCLKQKGHVVAVTGHKINDTPALETADVGLSLGIQGNQVAKASSDAEILDDSLSSIVAGLLWGRCLYCNVEKYIQFQLIVNVVVGLITVIGAVSDHDLPVTTFQYLWLDFIMEKLGALALATERPGKEIMRKPPVDLDDPLITNIMWRNILVQAVYQTVVLLTLQFNGMSLFSIEEGVRDTLIFNTFVLLQVFSLLNCRKLESRNVFEGMHKNRMFLVIVVIVLFIQVVMVEYLEITADTVKLSLRQWGISITIAAMTLPVGWIVKFVPVPKRPFQCYLPDWIRAPTDDVISAAEAFNVLNDEVNLVSVTDAFRTNDVDDQVEPSTDATTKNQ